MMPYFSIIIPLYNKEKHIIKTIQSVFEQTFSDYEIIVVNDGSTDGSVKALETITDQRISVYTTENKGVSHARNYGISKAKSNCIVFLDADDYWFPFHLQDLKFLYEKFPDCGLYAKAYVKEKYGIQRQSIFSDIPKVKEWNGIVPNYFKSSLANNIAWTSAVMIPKETFKTIGYFNEAYNSGEDTDLWIRIALKLPIVFYNKISAVHTTDSENKITKSKLSSRKHIDFNAFEEEAKTNLFLKKYLDLNRVAIVVQYKLEDKNFLALVIKQHIDFNNLNGIQKILLKMPNSITKVIFKFKNLLFKAKIDLRLFR